MRPSSFASLLAAALLVLPLALARAADCPSSVTFTPAETGSTADTGWTGLGLGRPIFGNSLTLGIDCAATSPPCGTCPITGAFADPLGIFQRCTNDTSIRCTVGNEVADCGAPDRCRIFLTPPQFATTGGVSSCYTNEIIAPVSGTVDDSGALSATVEYTGKIFNSCPKCVGDAVPNDGVQSGHCDIGPRAGLACDGNGVAPALYEEFGTSSFDCPPNPAAQIATLSPGPVTFSTGTQTRTLTPASPDCTASSAGPGAKCFCQTCNDAAAEPCFSNADCPPSGGNPGICGGKRCIGGTSAGVPCTTSSECPGSGCGQLGEAPAPNACFDFDCQDIGTVGDGIGECATGPSNGICANHPSRGCLNDNDCGGVAGACQSHLRPCYVTDGTLGQSISAIGVATPPVAGISTPTTLGMITCQGSTRFQAADTVIGLPGLARNHHVGTLIFGDSFAADCPSTPDTCRAPTVPGKAQIQLKDRTPDTKDTLKWSWQKGAATTVAELGDPTTIDGYVLCAYDANGLRMSMRVPAGGSCDGRPCWKSLSGGFAYKRKDGFPRGITQVQLRSGAAGKAKISVAGKGSFLPMPSLSTITAPLQVQLRNSTSGLCWGVTFPAPLRVAKPTELNAHD